MLARLYPANVTRWRLNRFEVLAKLAEERAEILEAFRRYVVSPRPENKAAISQEIADYFAWLIAVWYLSHRQTGHYSIQGVYSSYYEFGCPYCRVGVCACVKETQYGVRSDPQLEATNQYEPDKNKVLREKLRELLEELDRTTTPGFDKEQIKKGVSETQEKEDKKELISQLTGLQTAFNSLDKSAESIGGIAAKTKSLIEWLMMYWPG